MRATPLLLACLVAGLAFPTQVQALSVIVHYQGAAEDREVYFADMRSFSSQPPEDMAATGTRVRALPVTVVYENPNKPEFVYMELFFKCPERSGPDQEGRTAAEDRQATGRRDTVTFQIGPGSYLLRRADLKTEHVPQSDWKMSDAPMLSKAGILACNHLQVDQALRAAIKNDSFDVDGFGQRIAKLGLPADMTVIGEHWTGQSSVDTQSPLCA
ncbi:hypothetical protein H4W19_14750 [Pseudoxanthomonas mexicana]|uniref:DUF2330 domain-containing protein n=1 Tax=Pseudoxanthomonas mexicana TaxID=128785 RepID=A0ABX6R9V8_PSEMX|nr:hypothetical protein [Pseudoxanthomonas mexicana]QND79590.1 hypothetical protein H4W19_14750 [Pseudoxanthomonas mexicana]WBX93150.1 hypothetical protein PE064_15915 [Pseudoxanthomonas mexicana]